MTTWKAEPDEAERVPDDPGSLPVKLRDFEALRTEVERLRTDLERLRESHRVLAQTDLERLKSSHHVLQDAVLKLSSSLRSLEISLATGAQ